MTVAKPPFNQLDLAPVGVDVERRDDGSIVLSSRTVLPEPPRATGIWLEYWATRTPDATFLAQRVDDGAGDWRRLSYGEALQSARTLGQALLDRGLGTSRPLMFLSDNSLAQACLTLAALHVGVPIVPVSPAYSVLSWDFAKLRHIVGLTTPGLVYAETGGPFARALETVDFRDAEIVVAVDPPAGATRLDDMNATKPSDAVDKAFQAVGPDTLAKILFTSGSTGAPKGVINTQRMVTTNQEQIAAVWPFLNNRRPILVDWLPWSHTFGGNHDFNTVLRNGGCLYIDTGKPAPGRFDASVRNLREIAPTLAYNVPRGFEMLIPHLESDPAFRDHFFSELDVIFYAGASLPPHLWARLEDLSVAARGERVRMLSSWGTTETAPAATRVYYPIERAGVIGLPLPGTELKLVPRADTFEIRARGPNIAPGYWKNEALTKVAYDEEGFYIAGDAVRFDDPADPEKGLIFDGRLAEDFKLTTGTWVQVGNLRLQAIAAADPVIQDCVVTGHDRDFIGLLAFPDLAACRALCPDLASDASTATILADHRVRETLASGLARHNAARPASSTRIRRVILMETPARIDEGEITDKGYINQRAVLMERAAAVEKIYTDDDPMVVEIG
ncbi:MAG: feruloyl-CoA synthase [Alphaproteobacteria bacterium]|nr:feruloyl-CoA synthase [Alphaproteobacteria bacterium]